jgi:hypothetical protein
MVCLALFTLGQPGRGPQVEPLPGVVDQRSHLSPSAESVYELDPFFDDRGGCPSAWYRRSQRHDDLVDMCLNSIQCTRLAIAATVNLAALSDVCPTADSQAPSKQPKLRTLGDQLRQRDHPPLARVVPSLCESVSVHE